MLASRQRHGAAMSPIQPRRRRSLASVAGAVLMAAMWAAMWAHGEAADDASCAADPVVFGDLDGESTVCEGTPHNTTCALTCAANFTAAGNGTALCNDGVWEQVCAPSAASHRVIAPQSIAPTLRRPAPSAPAASCARPPPPPRHVPRALACPLVLPSRPLACHPAGLLHLAFFRATLAVSLRRAPGHVSSLSSAPPFPLPNQSRCCALSSCIPSRDPTSRAYACMRACVHACRSTTAPRTAWTRHPCATSTSTKLARRGSAARPRTARSAPLRANRCALLLLMLLLSLFAPTTLQH